MAHFKEHFSSAKEWLTKAEDAFDKQHDVRAELDLMLAQAELQHVKEANRSHQWRHKYLALRHGMALTLAMVMAVALGGVYWWTNKPALAIPVPLSGQFSLPVGALDNVKLNVIPTIIPKENLPPVQELAKTPSLPSMVEPRKQSESSRPVEQPRQVEQSRQVEQPVALSNDEMQKLVRAAGKSLRGQ